MSNRNWPPFVGVSGLALIMISFLVASAPWVKTVVIMLADLTIESLKSNPTGTCAIYGIIIGIIMIVIAVIFSDHDEFGGYPPHGW